MRVCIIGPSHPFRGGIPHYTTLLYKSLKKRHDTKFYAFKRQYPSWLFPGQTDKDNSRTPIRAKGIEKILDSLNPFTWWRVYRKIQEVNPDILIIPWWVSFWTPQFWSIATLVKRFSQTKILFICHNVVEHESSRFDKLCTNLVLKKGDYFIVHSGEDLRNLKRIVPDAKVKQCFHPTYEVFQSNSISKEEARSKLRLEGNTILFFGFVRAYKGLNYLIEAMPSIIKNIDLTLLIVGEFWESEKDYRRQIEELGMGDHIKIINRYVSNEDVGLYFAAADLAVLPYVSATGSGIVQVAFGCDRPVLSTYVGCLPEVIQNNSTGLLVPPREAQAIADAVIAFYREGKEEEFVKNIQKEKERFSWDRMVETVEELTGSYRKDMS
ncbi:MAG: glycosyltransferase [Planctomycetota bacterium]